MKPNLIFICLLIIISFYGCHKEVLYLNDDEKAIINAYNLYDQFKLLKNDTDTVIITVTEKQLGVKNTPSTNIDYETGILGFDNDDNQMVGSFTIMNSSRGSPQEYNFYAEYKKYIIKNSLTINNIFYNKIYFFQGYFDPADTMYYSANKGVVYIHLSDSTTYKLIE